ncbi:hypothetical protein NP493_320g02047 [Ridgeia piscesae]|uniref:DAGKc domain-containing protein n=1 Tax=Ridgeia piscesae TaxID=27915 RepID=A0AAD9L4Q5_RIDPI|nr:hypothetical protein NP493_320g02047 [Ridgeia piscesae]
MASSASETDQLKATLAIRNKPFLVKLTSSELCWESLCPNSPGAGASGTGYSQLFGSNSHAKGKFQYLEAITHDANVFSIWFIERYQQHRWRPRHVSFHSRDSSVAQKWVDRIKTILSRSELKRPRSLLIFINPIGGRKKGPSIYHKVAAPLFELADVSCDVVMTQRRNHARDILLEYDLAKVDGPPKNGWMGLYKKLYLGLPGYFSDVGSTDAVACSTSGTEDPMTAALHIILGDSVALDVGTVHQGDKFLRYNLSLLGYGDSVALDVGTVHQGDKFLRYNLSLLGYGYYGDCILESEATRWMGHADTTGWVIRGRFLAINSFLMSCRCRLSQSGPAPAAHLGDGCTDLVLIRQCSRAHFLQHLFRCTQKTDQFDLPFVDVFRVKAFQFRPLVEEYDDTHDASGCCSNGRQRLQPGAARNSVVHRQVLQMFARGIEDTDRKDCHDHLGCVHPSTDGKKM